MSKFRVTWAAICGFLNPFSSVVESVADYALGVLNKYLSDDNIASKVSEVYATANKVLDTLKSFSNWCPEKWMTEYCATITAVSTLVSVLADGKVEMAELDKCKADFKAAYDAWMSDGQ